MIIFYEGLPRSGKSLSALKDYVVPMLKQGRKVFAYIEGLHHEKLAELAEISTERCQELLHQITREQVPQIYSHVDNDSFVIIDELQNFWPTSRKPLDPQITQFITEHGHRGLDILAMGQLLKDVHPIWRNRVAQKNYYLKREAAGKPDQFSVTIYKPVQKGNDVAWQEIRKIKGQPYDKAYFGAYQSHTPDTDNKETLTDDRANVWNNPILKKWLPIMGVVAIASFWYVWHMFNGGLVDSISTKPVAEISTTQSGQVKPAPVAATAPVATNAFYKPATPAGVTPVFVEEKLLPDDPPDIVDHLSTTGRVRLSGYARMGDKTAGFIEWRSEGYALLERMSFQDLQAMGWMVLVNDSATLAIMQKYHRRYIATAWPLPDPAGKVSTPVKEVIAAE